MNQFKNITNIQIISDLHGEIPFVDDSADMIILLGDYGNASLLRDFILNNKGTENDAIEVLLESSKKVLSTLLTKKPCLAILGNADLNIKEGLLNFFKKNNIEYVGNKLVKINGLNVLFLDFFMERWWCEKNRPEKINKAVKMEIEINELLNKLKKVDLVFSHTPPYGFFDKSIHNKSRFGSKILLKIIKNYQPLICFSGHSHKMGASRINKTVLINIYKTMLFKI